MDRNLLIEKTRTIFESANKRLKIVEEFLAALPEQRDNKNSRALILGFSKFLTLKGVINWSDVTPPVVKSFIILNQNESHAIFNSKEWIDVMKEFFDFLTQKNIVKDNIFVNEEILLNDDFNERLSPERICSQCGIKIQSNIAKYCSECSVLVKREITLLWNKNHPDRVKKATIKWRERNKETIREHRLKKIARSDTLIDYSKWQDILKIFDSSLNIMSPSQWAEDLRGNKTHLLWMVDHYKRMDKIMQIEERFSIYWEDKVRETHENYNRKQAAKILGLNYLTLLDWARHLKLYRVCVYCNKKLSTAEGRFHPNCEVKHKPKVKMNVLGVEDEDFVDRIKNLLPALSERESIIIENRYLFLNKKETLEALGKRFNLTRERVRQIEKKALEKLKQKFKEKAFKKNAVV